MLIFIDFVQWCHCFTGSVPTILAVLHPAMFTPSSSSAGGGGSAAASQQPNSFLLSQAAFGSHLFPHPNTHSSFASQANAAVVPHFPSAMSSLLDAGFAHSAHILTELSLTFYAAGLEKAANSVTAGRNRTYASHNPTAQEFSQIPPPAALALFGQCCYHGGEYRRSIEYLKTALNELDKLKRAHPHRSNPAVQNMNSLNTPQREWTLMLIDAHTQVGDEAQAQRLLEQLYTHSLAPPPGTPPDALPPKYLLQLARYYAAPPSPPTKDIQQSCLTHNPRAAIAIHTRLIQRYPLAIESALELIRLNVDPRPIVAAAWANAAGEISSNPSLANQSLLLHVYLTAHWNAHEHRYADALSNEGGFNFLHSIAPRSTHILEHKALAQAQICDLEYVGKTLERLHSMDPYAVNGMDLLAFIYHKKSQQKEINLLMGHTMRVDENRNECWTIAGLQADCVGQKEKCEKFLDKAVLLASSLPAHIPSRSALIASVPYIARGTHYLNIESTNFQAQLDANHALAAAGQATNQLLPSKALDQAGASFRKAYLLAPHCLLAQYGLAQSSVLHAQWATAAGTTSPLHLHPSYKNALQIVTHSVQQSYHARNPRAFTNYGLILQTANEGRQKAAKALHKAIQMDREYTDAVLGLADMYLASKQYADALNMLQAFNTKAAQAAAANAAPASSSLSGATPPFAALSGSRDILLAKIGEIHALQGSLDEAMQCYKQAITINPTCMQAIQGMERIDQDAKAALDPDMELEEAT